MSEVTHQVDASQVRKPIKEKPFSGNPGEGEPVNPRNDAIEDISEKFEKQRVIDLHEAMEADPGLKQNQEAIEAGMATANATALADGLLKTDDEAAAVVAAQAEANDGAASRTPMHVPATEPEKPALPTELQDDPLANYIEIRDGKPMMKFKVDGETIYRDLNEVHIREQKNEAADRRLQHASEWQKDLQRRETNIEAAQERLNNQYTQQQQVVSPLPEPRADVDDLDITKVSKGIVSSLFNGTEEEAAVKLAETLTKINRSGAQPQPVIDADALVKKATVAARTEFETDNYNRNVVKAWNTFEEDFKDVMADEDAFAFADAITGKIEKDHPDWTPDQVMMEAGTRARTVVIANKQPAVAPAADADRQLNKDKLTPIPKQRTATQELPEEEKPQTAQEALDEIRRSRNQPI